MILGLGLHLYILHMSKRGHFQQKIMKFEQMQYSGHLKSRLMRFLHTLTNQPRFPII
jgi:hypothetical protein